jgi:hypothetical protein
LRRRRIGLHLTGNQQADRQQTDGAGGNQRDWEWLIFNKAETYGNSIPIPGFPEMTCFTD